MTKRLSFSNKLRSNQITILVEELTVTNFSSSPKIRLDIPAESKYLSVIGTLIRSLLELEEDTEDRETFLYQVELAVHEVCVNIIEHAYTGQSGQISMEVLIDQHPRRVFIDLYDTGISFDPSKLDVIDLNEPRVRGYGLFLVNQLMDEVHYSAQSGGNQWRLIKNY